MLNLGVIFRSGKENERRMPIHPDHFGQMSREVGSHVRFERGYAEIFGMASEELGARFGGTATREELLAQSDAVLMLKPMPSDLQMMREGGVLWGWCHCVQQSDVAQAAIDRRLTLIAWEAMFRWLGEVRDMHVFCRNNELAGYCAVIHAMALAGIDGFYGPRRKAVVLSHGSASRGAIYALRGRGVDDISVYTQRPPWMVHDKIVGCRYGQMGRTGAAGVEAIEEDGARRRLLESLSDSDIVVNGILQDTDNPLMYMGEGEEVCLKQGCLVVDVSCDLGMGFPFARPTSFDEPVIGIGPITYYAVDHTASYLWRAASWEISRVVLRYLEAVMGGPSAWARDVTLSRSIEICDGVVQNPKILSFQNRLPGYPHERSRSQPEVLTPALHTKV